MPADYNNPQWISYTPVNGLIDPFVNDIAIAPDGVAWIATQGGVNRFDGQTWQTYSVADGLAAPDVWAIAVDPGGSIWFGTSAGLSRLDEATWTTYTTADGLPSDAVTALAIDNQGAVWVGTAAGLSRFTEPIVATSPPPAVTLNIDNRRPIQGQAITIRAQVSGLGLPHYTLNLMDQPVLTLSYDNEILFRDLSPDLASIEQVSATMSQATFVITFPNVSSIPLNVDVSGEFHSGFGLTVGSWQGVASKQVVIEVGK